LEPITECGSRDLLAQVFGERRSLFDFDLVESYLQRSRLVRVDCIKSLIGGQDGGGGDVRGGGTFLAPDFEWQVSMKLLKAEKFWSRGNLSEPRAHQQLCPERGYEVCPLVRPSLWRVRPKLELAKNLAQCKNKRIREKLLSLKIAKVHIYTVKQLQAGNTNTITKLYPCQRAFSACRFEIRPLLT
jgi:hypothetical protein